MNLKSSYLGSKEHFAKILRQNRVFPAWESPMMFATVPSRKAPSICPEHSRLKGVQGEGINLQTSISFRTLVIVRSLPFVSTFTSTPILLKTFIKPPYFFLRRIFLGAVFFGSAGVSSSPPIQAGTPPSSVLDDEPLSKLLPVSSESPLAPI